MGDGPLVLFKGLIILHIFELGISLRSTLSSKYSAVFDKSTASKMDLFKF